MLRHILIFGGDAFESTKLFLFFVCIDAYMTIGSLYVLWVSTHFKITHLQLFTSDCLFV